MRSALLTKAPDYMLPASFTLVEALPRNANGKVDASKLPRAAGLP